MARWSAYGRDYGGWAPYVSAAERKRQAEKKLASLLKKGQAVSPVRLEGFKIARTFWGKAWCANLEAYSDFANRLPRGRSYLRNGSVIDLRIDKGEVRALVAGSSLYTVNIRIHAVEPVRWNGIIDRCSGQIDSLVELLQGKFSTNVMQIITSKDGGLFPGPKQIVMDCSCPDGASMCKHIAATLYGVGARLDQFPELFFKLRNVDHAELISAAGTATAVIGTAKPGRILNSADLSGIFGIDVDVGSATQKAGAPAVVSVPQRPPAKKRSPATKKPVAKKMPLVKPAATKQLSGKKTVSKPAVEAKYQAKKRPPR